MSIKHFIKRNFSKRAETNDNHWDAALQSHYYKTTKDEAVEKIESYFKQNNKYNLKFVSKDYGEIGLYQNKLFIVVTVVMVRPFHTAIDFTVTSETISPTDFGASFKCAKSLYAEFDALLPLSQ